MHDKIITEKLVAFVSKLSVGHPDKHDVTQYHSGFITALHAMQTRSSDENSVRPSVCLSVKRVIYDKMEERSVQIVISYERSFSLF